MVSLEELQRRNRKLKTERDSRRDFAQMDAEKRRLAKENTALSHPRRQSIVRNIGKTLVKSGAALTMKSQNTGKRKKKITASAIKKWI